MTYISLWTVFNSKPNFSTVNYSAMVTGHAAVATTQTLLGGMNAIDAKSQKQEEAGEEAMEVSAAKILAHHAVAIISDETDRCAAVMIAAIEVGHTNGCRYKNTYNKNEFDLMTEINTVITYC